MRTKTTLSIPAAASVATPRRARAGRAARGGEGCEPERGRVPGQGAAGRRAWRRGEGRGVAQATGAGRGGEECGAGERGGARRRGAGRRRCGQGRGQRRSRQGSWLAAALWAGEGEMGLRVRFFTSHGGMGPFRFKSFADCHLARQSAKARNILTTNILCRLPGSRAVGKELFSLIYLQPQLASIFFSKLFEIIIIGSRCDRMTPQKVS